jgi:hypothetical protein
MRHTLLALTLAALTTIACKKEETTTPTEGAGSSEGASTSEPAEPTSDAATAEPSADSLETCTHMGKLMQADLGDAVEITEDEMAANARTCATDLDTKRAGMTPEEWDTKRSCVMGAQTVEAVVACG